MARPKKVSSDKTVEKAEKNNSSNDKESATMKKIRAKFGDNTVVTANSILEVVPQVISVSPVIDEAIGGGGIQDGKIWVLSGPPRIGKTTTAFHYAGNAQKAGKKIIYVSCESRLENRNVLAVNGLKIDEVEVVRHCKGKILTAEDWLSIVEDYIKGEENCVIIVDSISILCEDAEMTSALGKQKMAGASKLVSQFIRRNSPIVPVMNHVLILIAQQYQNPNPMQKKYIAKFGSSVDYALSYYMQFTHSKPWKEGGSANDEEADENAKEIGQFAYFNLERSPTAGPKNKIVSYQKFGEGIDEITEFIKIANPLGVIKKSGSWYSSSFHDNFPSIQGEHAVKQFLVENPDILESLKEVYKEMTT